MRTAANDNQLHGASVRFAVEPRLIPAAKAARRLHLTPTEFEEKRAALHRQGFPLPCPVVEHFDLIAIDAWLDRMSSIGAVGPSLGDPERLVAERIAAIG
ncbi:MAG: hypothetical protein E5Y79_28335 [Mesorhizobium sp.]|uniref:hypothetical protein n=1 Tax=Mesorhizobium sp. TaxID=1871066 RepID=UPI00120FA300|nr:hypothetical protein [Mesorhizobium sp.]TIL56717.1 MAG: hypothetical protein E5Y79_28335 [Mesorhizobium sp.]